jgi:hypothetical protein
MQRDYTLQNWNRNLVYSRCRDRRKYRSVPLRFQSGGIAIAYVMGYSLAGFTTFVTILDRLGSHRYYETGTNTTKIDSCCSVLEKDSTQGFVPNIETTLMNFGLGFKRLLRIRNQRRLKSIVKSTLFILITAESAYILTAETVDLIFYQYSILLSVPLALLMGAFTVVAPAAYRKTRQLNTNAKLQSSLEYSNGLLNIIEVAGFSH